MAKGQATVWGYEQYTLVAKFHDHDGKIPTG
jgi:hypothetical protein